MTHSARTQWGSHRWIGDQWLFAVHLDLFSWMFGVALDLDEGGSVWVATGPIDWMVSWAPSEERLL